MIEATSSLSNNTNVQPKSSKKRPRTNQKEEADATLPPLVGHGTIATLKANTHSKQVSFSSSTTQKPRRTNCYPRPQDFTNLETPHPYGILPGGNQFLSRSTTAEGTTTTTTTTSINLLNAPQQASPLHDDEVYHTLLSFCQGQELARLAQTCRFWYATSHQLELWRDLVLRQLSEEATSQQDAVLQSLEPSWKDTYVKRYLEQNHKSSFSVVYRPHVPMSVRGVYSDYFYRLHASRTFCIPWQWLEPNNDTQDVPPDRVPVVPHAEMTTRRFLDDFEGPNRPVLIQGAATSWKCFGDWQNDPHYLEQQTQGRSFRATSGAAPLPAQFNWAAYRQYCAWQSQSEKQEEEHHAPTSTETNSHNMLEEAPLYLFDRTALQPHSTLWKDYHPDLCRTCPYWDPEKCPEHDLFALLGEGRRPDHTWWIAGPKRSGSVFHMDPNATHAWNAALSGRKRWIFYPPGMSPPGVHPSADADQVALPLTVGEWLLQFWPQHVTQMKQAASRHSRHSSLKEGPMEITAHPGDVIFVPHGWWHMVINLDSGLNMAITHNYVSQSNLDNVLRFLKDKEDQISGCRDRTESIKPHDLHSVFCDVLRQHHPQWLAQAQQVPDWTCRAWSSPANMKTEDGHESDEQTTVNKKKQNIMDQARADSESNTDEKESNPAGFSFSFM